MSLERNKFLLYKSNRISHFTPCLRPKNKHFLLLESNLVLPCLEVETYTRQPKKFKVE